MTRRAVLFLIPALLALADCRAGVDAPGAAAADGPQYLSPPEVRSAQRGPDQGWTLSGRAGPGDEVRLQSPDGEAYAAAAGDDGLWTVSAPPAERPRMFRVEGEDAGRILPADGALILLPGPAGYAASPRPGAGAVVLARPAPGLRILALDVDPAGGGVVSGAAAPRAPVRLFLDGALVGASTADAAGRFSVFDLDSRHPVSAGEHVFRVQAPNGPGRPPATADLAWRVLDAAPAPDKAFAAERQGAAWRVSWRVPGGGVQTTVLLDAPGVAAW